MTNRQISNVTAPGWNPLPQPGWTIPVPPLNDQHLLCCINTAASTLNHGDVVVYDRNAAANAVTGWIPFPAVAAPPTSPQSAGVAVTTTTTANDPQIAGPVSITGDASTASGSIAIGGMVWVVLMGVARVQIAAQVVLAGDKMATVAVAKTAIGTASASVALTQVGAIFGVAQEATAAKDANNTIRCAIHSA